MAPKPCAMTQSSTSPIKDKQRIEIIDIIRGVALLGILMMNIPYFSNPYQYNDLPTLNNSLTGYNYYAWWSVNGLFEGTMRGLFTILFGAGSILLLNRLDAKNPSKSADIFYRRLLWLLLFGMINAFVFLWPGDILYSYALCGLMIFPFRNMKARSLLLISIGLLIFTVGKDTYNLYERKMLRVNGEQALALEAQKKKLTPAQEEAKGSWVGMKERMDPTKIKAGAETEISKMQQGYFGVMAHLRKVNVMIQTTKFYSSYFMDIMSLLFLGMALLKFGVLTARRSRKFYFLLMLAGYGIGLPASYWLLQSRVVTNFNSTLIFDFFPVDLYQIKRLFLSLGHMSALILLYKSGFAKMILGWLKRVGQMAFSNYLMQSIFCAIIFYGFGFKLFGKLQLYQEYYVVGSIWIFQIIFSNLWMHYFRFGPFEWLWRSLTYWKKQPLRREKITTEVGGEKEETVAPALA